MYLRRHFSGWVENESFSIFHFRHRPEKGKSYTASNNFDSGEALTKWNNFCRERRCSGGEGSGRGAEPEDRLDAEVQWGDLYKSPPTRWAYTFSWRDLRQSTLVRWRPRATNLSIAGSSTSSQSTSRPTTCCIARLPTSRVVDLIKEYHRKHWQEDGVSLPSRCFVSRITLPCPGGVH